MIEEPSLVRQLLKPIEGGRSPGERRGFAQVEWSGRRVLAITLLASFGGALLTPIGLYSAFPGSASAAIVFTAQVVTAYLFLAGLVVLVGLRGEEQRWQSLGFRPLDVRSLAGLLAFLASVIIAVNLLGGLVINLPAPRDIFLFGREPLQVALMAFTVIIAAPVGEELFFRGFLLQGAAHHLGFWPAALVSGGLFAVAHASLQLFPAIFVLGVAFAWLFWRTGSLWAPIAAHATINGSSFLVLLFFSSASA